MLRAEICTFVCSGCALASQLLRANFALTRTSSYAVSVAKVRSDKVLDNVLDENASALASTLSGRLHKDASLHNALNLVNAPR